MEEVSLDAFKRDILMGLSKKHKQIQSKYFYDELGGELFNKITRHPDYYLTNSEIEILMHYKRELATLFAATPFNLIELGPGEGIKSSLLMKEFIQDSLSFRYFPIDISNKYLLELKNNLETQFSSIKIIPIHEDYLEGIQKIGHQFHARNIVLFLGSSIGNFNLEASEEFISKLGALLHEGDFLFIGFDLKKDPAILLRAYNDSDNLTRDFNLNLLRRINLQLKANFNLDAFCHHASYNVYAGAMESFLLSLGDQKVQIEVLEKEFEFKKFEPIQVESSYKFTFSQIEVLAAASHFEIIKNFTDSKNYFVNSLWRVKHPK